MPLVSAHGLIHWSGSPRSALLVTSMRSTDSPYCFCHRVSKFKDSVRVKSTHQQFSSFRSVEWRSIFVTAQPGWGCARFVQLVVNQAAGKVAYQGRQQQQPPLVSFHGALTASLPASRAWRLVWGTSDDSCSGPCPAVYGLHTTVPPPGDATSYTAN